MVDLTAEMAQLWSSLGPAPSGRARVVQFIAATSGEGASTFAREFARFAAGRARKPVWLIDLDLLGSRQLTDIVIDPTRFGAVGAAAVASPDGSAFFTVQPPAIAPDGKPWRDSRYLVAHPVGGSRLWVTRFRREALRPDQAPHVVPVADYWNALRPHAEVVVVDAPAADRARAGLTVAPFMDLIVLVVAADGGDAARPIALRDAVHAAGGHCAGLVFNRASLETPKFLKVLLP